MNTKEIDIALTDPDNHVRAAAASDVNITKEQLDIALNDPHWYVRGCAASNININTEQRNVALNDSAYYVRCFAAINNTKINNILILCSKNTTNTALRQVTEIF